MNIQYNLKPKDKRRDKPFIPEKILPFGKLRTDHMFLMNYIGGEWKNPRITPYGNLNIMPGAIVLHYGQAIFEGAKAFEHEDGNIYTFRLDKNANRLNESAKIMCMPKIPIEDQIEAVHALIDVERLWFPKKQKGASIYIRPFMVGIDDCLGVHPSKEYTFCVMLSPSGPYYKDGFSKPINLLITKKYHRAAPGGTGAAKAAGNYGASLMAGEIATKFGTKQVLYLNTKNTLLEEAGAMNHYHIENGTILIPKFNDTILRSITSQSVMELSNQLGVSVKQKELRLEDFLMGIIDGRISEAGGLGTAAVISPVGTYRILKDELIGDCTLDSILNNKLSKDELAKLCTDIKVGDGEIGNISLKVYEMYTNIQTGNLPAPDGWLRKVEHQ